MAWIQWIDGAGLPARGGSQRPGLGRELAAARQPSRFVAQALVVGHSSRSSAAFASGVLPGRVYVPFQSAHFQVTRAAVLPADQTGERLGACIRNRPQKHSYKWPKTTRVNCIALFQNSEIHVDP